MTSVKVSEKHKITLDKPYLWEYNPDNKGIYKTSKFLNAVEDIGGVIDVEYDFEADRTFFVTIDANYCFENLKELIRSLSHE